MIENSDVQNIRFSFYGTFEETYENNRRDFSAAVNRLNEMSGEISSEIDGALSRALGYRSQTEITFSYGSIVWSGLIDMSVLMDVSNILATLGGAIGFIDVIRRTVDRVLLSWFTNCNLTVPNGGVQSQVVPIPHPNQASVAASSPASQYFNASNLSKFISIIITFLISYAIYWLKDELTQRNNDESTKNPNIEMTINFNQGQESLLANNKQIDRGTSETIKTISVQQELINKFKFVEFESGSSNLSQSAFDTINEIRQDFRELNNNTKIVLLSAHTDTSGSKTGNKSLARKRGEAVLDALSREGGIPKNKIFISELAEESIPLITGNKSPDYRNRVVEIEIR